jgi:hypothetical protein
LLAVAVYSWYEPSLNGAVAEVAGPDGVTSDISLNWVEETITVESDR